MSREREGKTTKSTFVVKIALGMLFLLLAVFILLGDTCLFNEFIHQRTPA